MIDSLLEKTKMKTKLPDKKSSEIERNINNRG